MSRTILAIDPGTKQSGFVFATQYEDLISIIESGTCGNDEIRKLIQQKNFDLLAVETVASYGAKVGASVFETCIWVGRFLENWGGEYKLIYRKSVLKHFAVKQGKGNDSRLRQALIDKFGEPGTSKEPGGTYGVSSHAWSALGVAVTALEV